MERFEKIYGTNPSKLLSFNVIDIGALSTELILWFSQEASHNVPAQYYKSQPLPVASRIDHKTFSFLLKCLATCPESCFGLNSCIFPSKN